MPVAPVVERRPVLADPWVFLTADPDREQVGVPIGSHYVEDYWTPIVGPSGVAFLRLIARTAERWAGQGERVKVAVLASRLGLGAGTSASSPVARTMDRLCLFGFARWHVHEPDRALEVFAHALPISPTRLRGLPQDLQNMHADALAAARGSVR
jgi:hypothetical protein